MRSVVQFYRLLSGHISIKFSILFPLTNILRYFQIYFGIPNIFSKLSLFCVRDLVLFGGQFSFIVQTFNFSHSKHVSYTEVQDDAEEVEMLPSLPPLSSLLPIYEKIVERPVVDGETLTTVALKYRIPVSMKDLYVCCCYFDSCVFTPPT